MLTSARYGVERARQARLERPGRMADLRLDYALNRREEALEDAERAEIAAMSAKENSGRLAVGEPTAA